MKFLSSRLLKIAMVESKSKETTLSCFEICCLTKWFVCVCVCVFACPTQAYSHSIIVDYNHLSIICKCLHLYPSLFSVPPVLPRSASCRTFICLDFERSSFLNNFIDTCFCGYGVITTWSLFYESVL